MRLQQWKTNGWLQAHQTTPAQIADLLAIVERDQWPSLPDSTKRRARVFPGSEAGNCKIPLRSRR